MRDSTVTLSRRWRGTDAATRSAISRLLQTPRFELIPGKRALDQAQHLPVGAQVSVTASPAKGMEATLDLAEDLIGLGFDVMPHVSARLIRDRAQLVNTMARIDASGIQSIFVIGGDSETPGAYMDAMSLLVAMNEIPHGIEHVSIAGYPEGHPLITDGALWEALSAKAPFADSITTQMSFDASAVDSYARVLSDRGFDLPIVVGLPGVANRLKLLQIAGRIGVGDSIRFLKKSTGLVSQFASRDGYSPDHLLRNLGPTLRDRPDAIASLHLYTFNECEQTERWRLELISRLGE